MLVDVATDLFFQILTDIHVKWIIEKENNVGRDTNPLVVNWTKSNLNENFEVDCKKGVSVIDILIKY